MQNKTEEGKILTFTAGTSLTGGQALLVGDIFGVVEADAATGDLFALNIQGVFSLPKASSIAISQGQNVFWDATASKITPIGAGNRWVGKARFAVESAATTVEVLLTPGVPGESDSEVQTVLAPANVETGDFAVVGGLFVQFLEDADSSDPVQVATKGDFTVPKKSTDVIAAGDIVYWDAANEQVTLSQAFGFYKIGTANLAAGNGVTSLSVNVPGGAEYQLMGAKIVSLPAPTGGTTAGILYLVGANCLGVALETKAQTLACLFAVGGIHVLAKKSADTIDPGQIVYLDDSQHHITETAASKYKAGIALETAGNAVTSVKVSLDGIAVVQEGA